MKLNDFTVKAHRVGRHTLHHTCYELPEGVFVLGDVATVKEGKLVTMFEDVRRLVEKSEYKALLPGHGEYAIKV